jgi:hypothetical protein
MEQKFQFQVGFEGSMQAAIDRVMHIYGMLVNLTVSKSRRHERKSQVSWQAPKLTTRTNSRSRAFVICGPLPGARSIKFETGCPPGRYHAAARSSFSVPRATVLSAWSGKGRCNAS